MPNWFHEVRHANWESTADVRQQFGSADFVGDRIVFNVGGNRYRIVAAINYTAKIVYIKFVGTHSEYDEIDVAKVRFKGKR